MSNINVGPNLCEFKIKTTENMNMIIPKFLFFIEDLIIYMINEPGITLLVLLHPLSM